MTTKPGSQRSTLPIRWRAILAICLLVPLNSWFVVASAIYVSTSPTQVSLYFNAVFTILVFVGLNWVMMRATGRFLGNARPAFNRAEVLTVYSCVSIGSGLAGIDRIRVLIPQIGHAIRYATPENDWVGLFHAYLPDFLTLGDPAVMDGYYDGSSTFFTMQNVAAWTPIILWWTVFTVALHLVMLSMSVIIRRQWVEHERLTYPVIELPRQMSEPNFALFKTGWLWVGLGVGITINVVNGLNYLYPAVPSLGGKLYDLQLAFRERPWNAIAWSPIGIFPFAVGMSFFMPLDLAFSLWAFWLLWRVERIVFSMTGFSGSSYGGTISYESDQSHGAYLGLALLAVWMSRHHLAEVWRRVWSPGSDREREPFSYRASAIALMVGFGFLIFFGLKMGMSLWVVVLYFIIWFAIGVAITRLRAELGSPVHDLHFIGPDVVLPNVFGTRRLGTSNLVAFSYLYYLNRAHRSHGMPHQLEAFKLSEIASIPGRRLGVLMLFSAFLGFASAFVAFLALNYETGNGGGWGWESFNRLERWLVNPATPNVGSVIFMGVGFLTTVVLAALRMRFIWWYLHPVGYAVSGSWAINPLIGSIFAGWFLKWLILRFGGIKTHRAATPFFLGLLLGDFTGGMVWTALGVGMKQTMYRFLF